jgi:hypothetical protein
MKRSKRAVAESSQVERARKKFGAWRRSRKVVSRIPDDLWELALGAAREVGVNQAARALGLEYYALKKRLDTSADRSILEPSGSFVEFDSSGAPPFFTEWAVELENDNGVRMRVAARSPSGPDVVGLCRAFCGEEK